jgi:hypothetical protein
MRTVLLFAAMLIFPMVSATDDPCDHQDPANLTIPDAAGAAGGDLYVVNDNCGVLDYCVFSLWIYQEANGHPGLQRSDEVVSSGCPEGDTGIF